MTTDSVPAHKMKDEKRFDSIKDRLIDATGDLAGESDYYNAHVHMSLDEWDRQVAIIERLSSLLSTTRANGAWRQQLTEGQFEVIVRNPFGEASRIVAAHSLTEALMVAKRIPFSDWFPDFDEAHGAVVPLTTEEKK